MSFAVDVCSKLVHIMWISEHYRTVNVHITRTANVQFVLVANSLSYWLPKHNTCPVDYMKKNETCHSISELHVKVYF